jgi:O-antigen/teichoic acid export membrane protein
MVLSTRVDFRQDVSLALLRSAALVALYLWWLRRQWGRVDWQQIPDYLRFGLYQAASALTHFFVLGSIDSLILNAYHGDAAVGLYGAYYAAFNVLVSRFIRMFSTVFLPTASAHAERDRLLHGVAGCSPGWRGCSCSPSWHCRSSFFSSTARSTPSRSAWRR